jgi:hypothetical protein
MFTGCKSLVRAPKLPANVLEDGCYYNMFSGCTSLEKAPLLPANTLAERCYRDMFYNCTSLKQITILAIDINIGQCRNWLKGTSPYGTFQKNKNAVWENDEIVPSGWEIELIE